MEENSSPKLVVVGQGYVGLPLAMRAVQAGFSVVGIDYDQSRISALQAKTSFVDDVSDNELEYAYNSGRYIATGTYNEAAGFDYAVITVPTPLKNSNPDLTYVESATHSLAEYLTPGSTVVLESTTYPGTTQELVVPILEEKSGLVAGADFFVGYSPERIDPGNKSFTFKTTPKIVSGINQASLERVQSLFGRLVERTVPVSTPREAEMAKLLENTFRHVNIALVNELAVFAHELGVNIWEVIDAAATKPFGFMKFTPGPGVGGHCLPIDPSYLSWKVKSELNRSFRFVDLANDVNDHMPEYVVRRAMELLNEQSKPLRGSRVLILGVAYKRDSSDAREAPALAIIRLLREQGALISAIDPHVDANQWPEAVEKAELTKLNIDRSDVIVLVTDHTEFDLNLLKNINIPVLDTRNVLEGDNVHPL